MDVMVSQDLVEASVPEDHQDQLETQEDVERMVCQEMMDHQENQELQDKLDSQESQERLEDVEPWDQLAHPDLKVTTDQRDRKVTEVCEDEPERLDVLEHRE